MRQDRQKDTKTRAKAKITISNHPKHNHLSPRIGFFFVGPDVHDGFLLSWTRTSDGRLGPCDLVSVHFARGSISMSERDRSLAELSVDRPFFLVDVRSGRAVVEALLAHADEFTCPLERATEPYTPGLFLNA